MDKVQGLIPKISFGFVFQDKKTNKQTQKLYNCLCSLEDLLQHFDWCLQKIFQFTYFHQRIQNIQDLFEKRIIS